MSEYQAELDPTEIVGWYIPRTVPAWHESYRTQMLGVAFPIRQHNVKFGGQWMTYDENAPEVAINEPDEIIIITAEDAVKALKLSQNEAAASILSLHRGSFGADIRNAFLVFERNKGHLLSQSEMEQQFPIIAEFGEAFS